MAWESVTHLLDPSGPGHERPVDPSEIERLSFLADLQREAQLDETLIVHTMPESAWRSVRDALNPRTMIGHFVWEGEQVPEPWRQGLEVADELWVPTEWNAGVFRAAGLDRPVHVVPHVTAPFLDDPVDGDGHGDGDGAASAPIELPDDHVVFLMVSAWDWRKRPDRTIDAFLTAFHADDPVTLVVKSSEQVVPWPNAARDGFGRAMPVWRHVMDVVKRHPRPANVVLDTTPWSEAEMHRMLVRADCHVSLTSNEGWGLGAFDAACVGTPVLITGYGGQVEWLGADYPGLLPFVLEPVAAAFGTSFEPGMSWAAPDIEAAVEAMRSLAEGRAPQLLSAAAALEPKLRERYSPAAIGALAASLLP